jgi:hypothetical protein
MSLRAQIAAELESMLLEQAERPGKLPEVSVFEALEERVGSRDVHPICFNSAT